MKLLHVALTAGSEEKSDSFFVGLLGLEKMEPKTIPAALTEKLFDLTGGILAVNYLNSSVRFEVFIMSNPPDPGRDRIMSASRLKTGSRQLKRPWPWVLTCARLPRANPWWCSSVIFSVTNSKLFRAPERFYLKMRGSAGDHERP